jgi:hypothetical protein
MSLLQHTTIAPLYGIVGKTERFVRWRHPSSVRGLPRFSPLRIPRTALLRNLGKFSFPGRKAALVNVLRTLLLRFRVVQSDRGASTWSCWENYPQAAITLIWQGLLLPVFSLAFSSRQVPSRSRPENTHRSIPSPCAGCAATSILQRNIVWSGSNRALTVWRRPCKISKAPKRMRNW